jgi:hypothetical protein
MIFLAGRDRYTQRTLLRAIHDRLSKQAGCEAVRYDPSRLRPRTVVANIDPTAFLGSDYDVETARLETRFWYPEGVDYEYYHLNWVEPTRDLMLGYHQDADHPDIGRCHLQLDFEGETVDRQSAAFLDAHPLAVLEQRLQQLPSILGRLSWEADRPSLARQSK